MANPKDTETDPAHSTEACCGQPKGEDVEPVRCRVCHRPLKTEASIAAGVGPACAKKKGADNPEPSPRHMGRKIHVDPNQLRLPYDMQPQPKAPLEKTTKLVPQEIAPAELEESNAKTESLAPPIVVVTVEIKIVCPGQHPSLNVVISRKGEGACKGY